MFEPPLFKAVIVDKYNDTEVKTVVLKNALEPMLVTLAGIIIEDKLDAP